MKHRFPRARRAPAALTLIVLSLLLIAPVAAVPQQADRVAVGDTAIDFTMQSIDGEIYHLADLRGEKAAILIFFRGTW